jgi:hypothetical protein
MFIYLVSKSNVLLYVGAGSDTKDHLIIMAEIVSSAVVQETVSQVLSNLVQKYEEKDESNKDINLERLKMAHTRLEAVLETSDRWRIIDASCWISIFLGSLDQGSYSRYKLMIHSMYANPST